MVPIVVKSGHEFDEATFMDFIVNLCNQHKEKKRALAFAFIVYDFSNHTIVKILKDHDYWSSLDSISGTKISIFYIDSQDRLYEPFKNTEFQRHSNSHNPNVMHYITRLSTKSPLENVNELLKDELNINNGIIPPFVVFFQTSSDEIIDSFIVQLKKEQLEESFLELRDHIRNAVSAITDVKSEYYKNYNEIFSLIKNGVRDGAINKFIRTKIINKIGIGTILSFVKIISGAK